MIECLLLGDSIAIGTLIYKPDCFGRVKSGITSEAWNKKFATTDLTARTVVISLGSNDLATADTYKHLKAIRSRVDAKNVFWILPNKEVKPEAWASVNKVSEEFNDTVISTTKYSRDKIHPAFYGYRDLANQIKD